MLIFLLFRVIRIMALLPELSLARKIVNMCVDPVALASSKEVENRRQARMKYTKNNKATFYSKTIDSSYRD